MDGVAKKKSRRLQSKPYPSEYGAVKKQCALLSVSLHICFMFNYIYTEVSAERTVDTSSRRTSR